MPIRLDIGTMVAFEDHVRFVIPLDDKVTYYCVSTDALEVLEKAREILPATVFDVARKHLKRLERELLRLIDEGRPDADGSIWLRAPDIQGREERR